MGMNPSRSAHLYAAARTPFGRFGGALAGIRPDDLAAVALTGVLADGARPRPGRDRVRWCWGNANGAGEDNRNVGRMAVLLAGLPVTVPGATVNRLCGSGLDAAIGRHRRLASRGRRRRRRWRRGVDDPRAVGAAQAGARPSPPATSAAGLDHLGLAAGQPERMPAEWTVSLGEAAEQLADRHRHPPLGAGRLRR